MKILFLLWWRRSACKGLACPESSLFINLPEILVLGYQPLISIHVEFFIGDLWKTVFC